MEPLLISAGTGLDFTAIDFETANRQRKSACSLGLVVVRNGVIVEKKYWLIKPEPFEVDFYNQKVHGISISMLQDKLTFNKLWPEIEPYLADQLIVAHNAKFDLDVLSKTLGHYGISFFPKNYYCTLLASERFFQGNSSAKLNEVARYFELELNHHEALSDAVASAEIAIRLMSDINLEVSEQIKVNATKVLSTKSKFNKFETISAFCGPAQIEKDLNTLRGYLYGISCDDVINEVEGQNLNNWIKDVSKFANRLPYKIFIEKIEDVLADGIITSEEVQDLTWLCQQYLDKKNPYYNIITSNIQTLSGFLNGISIDRKINDYELAALTTWINDHRFLSGTWPFDQVLTILDKVAQGTKISEGVHTELLHICDVVGGSYGNSENSNKNLVNTIELTKSEICIPESSFCITGESKKYTRKELVAIIELYGGYSQNSVSGKIQYLVVCDEKNACWAFASYGRKVEKAIQLKAKGANLSVIYEEDLFNQLILMGFSH
tara:strand:- start:509 stop:1987 length:1479 start_codon:yes stop_codon:yes gene_type:complete